MILTFEFCALDEGAITTYFNVLGLTRLARAGIELTTLPRNMYVQLRNAETGFLFML
jgi:hypothetical protein